MLPHTQTATPSYNPLSACVCSKIKALTPVCTRCPPQLEVWFARRQSQQHTPPSPPSCTGNYVSHSLARSRGVRVHACVCLVARAHLSVSVCAVCMCICLCVGTWACQMCFSLCDRRGEGQREVLSRNRVSNVSYYTPRLGEKREEEEEEEEETWGFFSSEAFNWEFMEAAAVENEDLLCGLRSPDSSAAWR